MRVQDNELIIRIGGFDGKDFHCSEGFVREAIEKRLPQKPEMLKRFVGECPGCGSLVEYPMMKSFDIKKDIPHCKWCGQAIDWSDVK